MLRGPGEKGREAGVLQPSGIHPALRLEPQPEDGAETPKGPMGGLRGVPVGTWVMPSLQQGWLGAAGMDTGPAGPGEGGGHPKLGKAGWGLGGLWVSWGTAG